MIEEIEIIDLLRKIETGELQVYPTEDPDEIYAGNVTYKVSNGWEIVVFNDANTWDYLDNVKTSDGRSINVDELDNYITIRNYVPPDEVAKNIYKIPGGIDKE
ncbi:hypothetical protein MYP_4077 [Sporocytophaga myxococcoides]|uniref:DUF7693 domain-containing protein n=1 Tax=Sporocytophaga myxococcoides TaxID=153721 RepID=A0A098LKJ6_9BACT|nr:hypothetical protein [Sporocytophaga myxococcoides]GAL86847.1 hypothetical protein MYP_4077 [Sporocytophaga myxococcoides]